MPEGPSIIILKEQLVPFKNKKVLKAYGYADIDFNLINNQKITDFISHGKHTFICFKNYFLSIHLMMFGTYRINTRKENNPVLSLEFKTGEINFYTSQVKLFEGKPKDFFSWETDVMSEEWNPKYVENIINTTKDTKVCDALLNQDIFTGVGNIIKNEALFNSKIHPESLTHSLPTKKIKVLITETEKYSLNFLKWKKEGLLSQKWKVYEKKICSRCNISLIKAKLGKGKRSTYFCANCQILYK